MNRRAVLLPLLLAGCGLSERPYDERRQWPLTLARPAILPPRPRGQVLELRTLRAAPGLDARGLQSLGADGSLATAYYEEWSVPPAQGVEAALRAWLTSAGLFAAVIATGSRLTADLVIEGELSALWTEPAAHVAHASLAVTVIAIVNDTPKVAWQRTYRETAALIGPAAQDAAQAMLAAVALILARVETDLRGFKG